MSGQARSGGWGLGLFLAALVLAPTALLFDPRAAFYGDWDTHLWYIGWCGEFFREHGRMPAAINLAGAVGLPLPVFYGWLLYPALGLMSGFLGAAAALRVAVLALLAVEAYGLLCAGRSVFSEVRLSRATAAAALWSVYSLTNLYNRSALAEFFGGGLLFSALAFAVAAANESAPVPRRRYAWFAVFAAVGVMGSHPPTALFAGGMFAVLAVILWRFQGGRRPPGDGNSAFGAARRRPEVDGHLQNRTPRRGVPTGVALSVLAPAFLGGAALLPWFYATARLSGSLGITHAYHGIQYFPDRCDSFLARFSPVSWDAGAMAGGGSTPYLDAPLAAGLLVILAANLFFWFRLRREPAPAANSLWQRAAPTALGWALGGAVFFTALSLVWSLSVPFRFLGAYIQFAYRLAGLANACLLAAVLASAALAARRGAFVRFRRQARWAAAFSVILAGAGLAVKLRHAKAVQSEEAAPEFTRTGAKSALITAGYSRLGRDYSTPGRLRELTADEAGAAIRVALPVREGPGRFGLVGPAEVDRPEAGWAVTNVVNFPWNRVWINGRRAAGAGLARQGYFQAVYLPAGHSTLAWTWRPDPVWTILRRVAGVSAVLLAVATLVQGIAALVRAWRR